MAIIPYNTASPGGDTLAGLMKAYQDLAARTLAMRDWIAQCNVDGLRGSDFGVPDGPAETINLNATALNDTALQIFDGFGTYWGDGSGGTNREKVARLARG